MSRLQLAPRPRGPRSAREGCRGRPRGARSTSAASRSHGHDVVVGACTDRAGLTQHLGDYIGVLSRVLPWHSRAGFAEPGRDGGVFVHFTVLRLSSPRRSLRGAMASVCSGGCPNVMETSSGARRKRGGRGFGSPAGQAAGAAPLRTIPNRLGSASFSSRGTKRYSAPAGSRVTSRRASSPRTLRPCGTSFGSAA